MAKYLITSEKKWDASPFKKTQIVYLEVCKIITIDKWFQYILLIHLLTTRQVEKPL